MSATSKLLRRLRRKVARDEQLTPAQEQAFLRLMKVQCVPEQDATQPATSTVEVNNG